MPRRVEESEAKMALTFQRTNLVMLRVSAERARADQAQDPRGRRQTRVRRGSRSTPQ